MRGDGRLAPRQDGVNVAVVGVNVPFDRAGAARAPPRLLVRRQKAWRGEFPRSRAVPDVLYALLIVGGFALLLLCLRGLERL